MSAAELCSPAPANCGNTALNMMRALGLENPVNKPLPNRLRRTLCGSALVDRHTAAGPLFVGQVQNVGHADELDALGDGDVTLDQFRSPRQDQG